MQKKKEKKGVIANGKEIVLIESPILAFKRHLTLGCPPCCSHHYGGAWFGIWWRQSLVLFAFFFFFNEPHLMSWMSKINAKQSKTQGGPWIYSSILLPALRPASSCQEQIDCHLKSCPIFDWAAFKHSLSSCATCRSTSHSVRSVRWIIAWTSP